MSARDNPNLSIDARGGVATIRNRPRAEMSPVEIEEAARWPTSMLALANALDEMRADESVRVIVLSPISPHTLSNRPVVVPPDAVVRISIAKREQDALLTIDGQEGMPLQGGDVVEVREGRFPVSLIHSPNRTYFDVLRSKLGWGG